MNSPPLVRTRRLESPGRDQIFVRLCQSYNADLDVRRRHSDFLYFFKVLLTLQSVLVNKIKPGTVLCRVFQHRIASGQIFKDFLFLC